MLEEKKALTAVSGSESLLTKVRLAAHVSNGL